ncbi:15464_t:CDS:2 [Funneliformis caledonium]|uniref:15464_t:CDS:1 n=1 Tax=Funneliformis caledonium TaxID=1117310 RepID=A0A9N9FZ01_9GLOM|nr:15464_t:CDS:2 [Funneliformis caledonium]
MTIPEWMSNGRQHKFYPTSQHLEVIEHDDQNVLIYMKSNERNHIGIWNRIKEERLGSTDGKRSRIKEGRSSGTYRRWKAI